tara:strand:- start:7377 stop:7736 length:360 start_codon:yes stop_codon:yes gene_type:complete
MKGKRTIEEFEKGKGEEGALVRGVVDAVRVLNTVNPHSDGVINFRVNPTINNPLNFERYFFSLDGIGAIPETHLAVGDEVCVLPKYGDRKEDMIEMMANYTTGEAIAFERGQGEGPMHL